LICIMHTKIIVNKDSKENSDFLEFNDSVFKTLSHSWKRNLQ